MKHSSGGREDQADPSLWVQFGSLKQGSMLIINEIFKTFENTPGYSDAVTRLILAAGCWGGDVAEMQQNRFF